MVRWIKQTLQKHLQPVGYVRWSRMFMALLMLVSSLLPTLMWIHEAKAYALSPEVEKVIGSANSNLSAKFSFDKENNRWQFNKNGVASLASTLAKQQGGKDAEGIAGALGQLAAQQVGGSGKKDTSLYSVDLPVKSKDGITYYDNVTRLSFKMIPTFSARDGKLSEGRVVYPFMGNGKVVYTAKANGLKEDIVLSDYSGDTLRYSYELDLPETLEARLLDDGSIGIYSANPALFGDISFGGDTDKDKVMEARKIGNKDNLVFSIPAPFIKDQTGNAGHTRYELNGKQLSVVATGLKGLKYPLTVDPSVEITSSSAFGAGNNEGMTSPDAEQISREGITGANTATWGAVTATAPFTARENFGTATYNGFVYIVGGTNAALSGAVNYARLTANGTLSNNSCGTAVTWCAGPSITNTGESNAIAYNGYLYSIAKNKVSDTVEYIQINADGSLGASWSNANTGAAFPLRFGQATAVYNGYMYVLGGCGTGNLAQVCPELDVAGNTVYMAEIRASGQLGAWINANTGASFTQRFNHEAHVYNGYMYVLGGCSVRDGIGNCTGSTSSVYYAKVNNDGTLGAWASTGSFANARVYATGVVHNGYMYVLPGCDNGNGNCQSGALVNNTQYAPIYANGALGVWSTATTLASGRHSQSAIVSSGYIYQFGGCSSASLNCNSHANYLGDAQSARIDTAGATGSYGTATSYDASARAGFATVTYNNFLYVIGGTTGTSGGGGTMLKSTRYAPVDANGVVGSWSTASTEFNNTSGASHACNTGCTGRVNMSAGVHNGYLYIVGGVSNGSTGVWSDVQSAVICTGVNAPVAGCAGAGDLRNWTTIFTDYITNSTTTYTEANGRAATSMAIYNGVMYVIGGASGASNVHDHIYQSTLTSAGGAGNFATSSLVLPSARKLVKSFVVSNRLYIIGGGTGAGWAQTTNEEVDVRFTSVSSTGVLGATWTDANAIGNGGSGSSFVATGALHSYYASVSNNHIYIVGGYNGSGIAVATVYRAGINTNGSMGSWSATSSLGSAKYGVRSAVVNGSLHVIAGCAQPSIVIGTDCNSAGQMAATYQSARINNGGSGTTGAWTASSSTGAVGIGGYASYNGYVYSIRGCGGAIGVGDLHCDNLGMGSEGMRYAAVNPDGTFGSWQTLNSSGTPLGRAYGLSAVAHNGYLYVVGGCTTYASGTCTVMSNKVYYAAINSATGDVGAWAATTDFDASVGRYGLSAVAHNGYLYVVGGCTVTSAGNCTAYEDTVRVAQINSSNGTVGAWASAGANFATARFWHSAMVYNNKLYVLGGCSAMVTEGCTALRGDVQVIGVNSDGSLNGSWQSVRSFVTPRSAFGAVAHNGYMYISGGCAQFNVSGGQCADYRNDVQYAPILSSGDVGVWQKSVTDMTDGLLGHGVVVTAGHLVNLFGVKSSHTYVALAHSSPMQVIPRTGKYSKLLTISPTTEIASVYYNGTLGAGSSVSYKVAPISGVFGSVSAASQGTGSEPTPLCGLGSIYYVQIMTTLDDSTRAVFPDDGTGNMTDVTIYYRLNATPPPNLRLTGGKWFYSEMLQGLDICKA